MRYEEAGWAGPEDLQAWRGTMAPTSASLCRRTRRPMRRQGQLGTKWMPGVAERGEMGMCSCYGNCARVDESHEHRRWDPMCPSCSSLQMKAHSSRECLVKHFEHTKTIQSRSFVQMDWAPDQSRFDVLWCWDSSQVELAALHDAHSMEAAASVTGTFWTSY